MRYAVTILTAIVILIVGWIIARVISALVRTALRRTGLDERLAGATGEGRSRFSIAAIISQVVFFIVMIMVWVAAAQALGLTIITEPLNALLNSVFSYLPKLLGAAGLLAIAWLIATVVRKLIAGALGSTGLDERFVAMTSDETDEAAAPQTSLAKTVGDAAYWLILLFFLPGILGALELNGLQPVQDMVANILNFLPNLLSAAIILVVGWFVARIVQRIVTGFLAAFGLDALGERLGLASALGEQKLSGILGLVAYAFIFIPVILAALEALQLDALTAPVSQMLNTFLAAIPNLFGAALILVISYFIGRLVAELIASLLAGIGFDAVLGSLGLDRVVSTTTKPSNIVSWLFLVGIMLFATVEAAELLGFTIVAELVGIFIAFASRVVVGLIILLIGLWLSNLTAATVRNTRISNAAVLAVISRVVVLMLVGAMGLRQMGLANEIINLAFGLSIGAVAVAAAIAFGWGGRHAAGRYVEKWSNELEGETPS